MALTSYALAGGDTWRSVARGLTALPLAILDALGWAVAESPARGAGRAPTGRAGDTRPVWRAALAFAVGVGLLLVFGGLFRAADPAFADLLRTWTEPISVAGAVRAGLGFVVVTTTGLAAAYLVHTGPAETAGTAASDPGSPAGPRLGLVEWVVPVAMLDALFAVFVWVQLRSLFGGKAYVLSVGGPDYAVHARGGFGQLVVVTVLTLGVVTVLALWAGRTTPRERLLLRVLGGALCALTLVIVASALKRLGLYGGAYGFTVERLLGYAGEVWLGLVFVLLLGAGVRLRASWLPRATVATAVGVLLGLAAINPEALMARTLLSRLSTPLPVDYQYVATLSADAIEELDALPEPERSCVLARLAIELRQPDPWYGINLSRERARDLLATRPTLHLEPGCAASGHQRVMGVDQPPMADIGRAG